MNNIDLKKMQETQLEIALEVKRVCDKLKINYFLDSGSLLGAVRHQGFIPWDDDIDLGMLRSDYDRFIKEAPAVMNKKYFLQTWETDKYFPGAYAKIRKNGTIYREMESNNSGSHEGIYVDLFPYDVFPTDKKKRKWQSRRYYILRRLLIVKCGYKPWLSTKGIARLKRFIVYFGAKLFTLLIPKKALIKYYNYFSQKFNAENSRFYYQQAAISPYGKWIIPKKCFNGYTNLNFEGYSFKCPVDSKTYLSWAYGDYMTLPPKEKRVFHHNIIKLSFGNNQDK